MKETIKKLLDQYLEIVHSERNLANKELWSQVYGWNRDMWRGIPKTVERGDPVPFMIAPDNSLWSRLLDVDLREYYDDPEVYLETQLRMRIFHFKNFRDNTFFTNELFIWFGVITELSYFGAPIAFHENKEGWITDAIVKNNEDVDRLTDIDFNTGGLMPKIHRYYEVFKEYAGEDFEVMFPEWVRGPFCIATHLRGVQQMLMDLMLDPELVHRLMRYIVDQSKRWNEQRSSLLGTPIKTCKLYNDEISIPSISPSQYDEFIFPYEKELSEYYGELSYWHSCGDTTALIDSISNVPNLRMFHAGPWTSYSKAAEKLRTKNIALDICLNPEKDILYADETAIREKINDIKNHCVGMPFFIRADGLMPDGPLERELDKIKEWNRIAEEELRST